MRTPRHIFVEMSREIRFEKASSLKYQEAYSFAIGETGEMKEKAGLTPEGEGRKKEEGKRGHIPRTHFQAVFGHIRHILFFKRCFILTSYVAGPMPTNL